MKLKNLINIIIPIFAFGLAFLALNDKSSRVYYSISETSINIPEAFDNSKIESTLRDNRIPNFITEIKIVNKGNTVEEELKLKIDLTKSCLYFKTNPSKSENPIFVEIDSIKTDTTSLYIVLKKLNINKTFSIQIGAISNESIVKRFDINSINGVNYLVNDISQVKDWSKYDVLKWPVLIIVSWLFIVLMVFLQKRYIRFRIKPQEKALQVSERNEETSTGEFKPIEFSFGNYLIIITKAVFRCVNEGLYDFQINIKIRAEDNNLFLESIKVRNKQDFISFDGRESNYIGIRKFISDTNEDFINGTNEQVSNKIKDLFKGNSVKVLSNYRIEKDSQQELVLIDRIETTRFMDCYDEMPQFNWKLEIGFNSNNKVDIPFDFEIRNYERWQYK